MSAGGGRRFAHLGNASHTRTGFSLRARAVTFLFTDVEGSTKRLHELGAAAYSAAFAERHRIVGPHCRYADLTRRPSRAGRLQEWRWQSSLGLVFWLLKRASSSACRSASRPLAAAASNAFMVGP